ncbi:hypothetical protein [Sciscionella marina]|uniref:hypothetical protein n=1 Tax=Sciscionella marina TaxID=508770 RepID=UPI000367EE02|nr:hypothetical protein [Sciscionella marina]
MAHQVNALAEDLTKSMNRLKETMRGIQIRRAGFKHLYNETARAVASYSVGMVDAKALYGKQKPGSKPRG